MHEVPQSILDGPEGLGPVHGGFGDDLEPIRLPRDRELHQEPAGVARAGSV